MPLDALTFTVQHILNWNATKNVAGSANGNNNSNSPNKTVVYSSTIANNAAGGADEMYSLLLTIPPSGNVVIDMRAFTDIMIQAGQSLARLKHLQVRLLSSTEASPDGVAGTACTSITIGNSGTNAQHFGLDQDSSSLTLNNGGCLSLDLGGAGGVPVDATNKDVKILNNDVTANAIVLVTFAGGST